MIRTQIYLPEDLYEELKLLAQTTKSSFSKLIREGVQTVVEREQRKHAGASTAGLRGIIGLVPAKGRRKENVSGKIDYYLYVKPYERRKKQGRK